MKQVFSLLFVLAPCLGFAQDNGIHFEHSLSWTDILAKAKAENKYIFMDCFTTWCGPCKYMAENVFPLEEVGNFLNKNFISVKVQLDTTAADKDEVKNWYQTGHDLAQKYSVKAYPTYLFFDENGQVAHRFVGSSDPASFITKAKNATNPEKQYYALLNKYNEGKKDSAFLYRMATAAFEAFDMENAKKIADEYLATQQDLLTKSNLEFFQKFTQSSKDTGFQLMLQNSEKVDAVLGKGMAEITVQRIIMQEEIYKKFPATVKENPDWKSIEEGLSTKYPKQAAEILAKGKITWYQHSKDWHHYQTTIDSFIKKYGAKVASSELNDYAWTIFQNCKDKACVEAALEWSKRSFAKDSVPGYLDTYANLLYKLGKKDLAIEWETKAEAMAEGDDKKGYQDVIDKMKKGEKTWNE